ncbi:glutamate 5-kinase [Panacagrimonas perspica]|uniref:Glutamate 5-kinase n=1 Tax=Panacagrimonas perspica TaxID=381431 RepID=A0A4S3K3K8_9GAMM|nr:glutamate 5-kinase [Panacagrimonas perspica]TDU31234.1 glutamate 5-kinase [Panacagrimonas perspica]THD02586.1 glutamate 5-kinase [Panacagrimonas perspica]
MTREKLKTAKRWVIKIGSSLLTARGQGLDHEAIRDWCAQIAALRAGGRQIVLVSSGAVAEGMARLGLKKRPGVLHELQAAAAVGQMGLVRAWELGFETHGIRAAQILLTHEDVADRSRYLNARATLKSLLEFGVVPVVNENDTVSTDEIRLGDNDTLGALTTNLIEADLLVILTDQDGLFDADPRIKPDAKLVSEITLSAPELTAMAGDSKGELGRGGMRTKLSAARIAARSGASTAIAFGKAPQVLERLAAGESLGTLLLPDAGGMSARKRWIAGQLQARGKLHLDAGAVVVLKGQGKSLLPVGVKRVEGDFDTGDLVICLDPDGREIARGLSNYSASDAGKILGAKRDDLMARLGYPGEAELIHRDNLVLS